MTKDKLLKKIKSFKTSKEAYCFAFRQFNIERDVEMVRRIADECCLNLESAEWIEHVDEDDSDNPMLLAISYKSIDVRVVDYFMEKHFKGRKPKLEKDSPVFTAWRESSHEDNFERYDSAARKINSLLRYYDRKEYLKMLLDKDIDSDSPRGALCEAARLGDLDMMKNLVEENGLSITHKDSIYRFQDPLFVAVSYRRPEITKYLACLYGKNGVMWAYEAAFSINDLEFVLFLCKDCGFDLRNEYWVEQYIDEPDWLEIRNYPMMEVLKNDNTGIFRYCFENHYGDELPESGDAPFTYAKKSEAFSIIDYLISIYGKKAYMDILLDECDGDSWVALCEAARLDDLELVRYLFEEKNIKFEEKNIKPENPAEIDSDFYDNEDVEEDDQGPVNIAITHGNLELAKYIVKGCGFIIWPWYTVYNAAKKNQLEILDYLIGDCGLSGYSAVFCFVEDKKFNKAFELINKHKIDVDELFCELCRKGNKSENVLPFLKELYSQFKIDVSHKAEKTGLTALASANNTGCYAISKWLVDECGANTENVSETLSGAVYSRNMDLVKYLVEELGSDVNARDKNGWPPLFSAMTHITGSRKREAVQDFEMAKYLVGKGADVNATDSEGRNILHHLANNWLYNADMFEWFVNAGADYMAFDDEGESPLHIAARCYFLDVVKSLVSVHGMDPNYHKRNGKYPIHCAADGGAHEVVKWFVGEEGVDINLPDNNGCTVLHYAVLLFCQRLDDEEELEKIRWLVDHGANINSFNGYGLSPLHIAVAFGNEVLIKFFVEECHMNPAIERGKGTPAEYAVWLLENGSDLRKFKDNGLFVLKIASTYGIGGLVIQGDDKDILNGDATIEGWAWPPAGYAKKIYGIVKYLQEKEKEYTNTNKGEQQ